MSTITKFIKSKLIKNQLMQKLEPPFGYHLSEATGEIGKAYAAEILSVVNYGFNVANRAELRQENENEMSWGESGINLDLSHSGRYLRSEAGHPSREVYTMLKKLSIEPLSSGVDDEKKEIQTLQDKLKKHNLEKFGEEKDYIKEFRGNFLNGKQSEINIPDDFDQRLITDVHKIQKIQNYNKLLDVFNKSIDKFYKLPLKDQSRENTKKKVLANLDQLDNQLSIVSECFTIEQKTQLQLQINLHKKLLEVDLIKLFDNKADGDKAYWLGQWKTPEDVIEDLFSELNFDEVNFLSKYLLNEAQKSLDLNGGLGGAKEQIDLSDYQFSRLGTFDQVMDARVKITQTLTNAIKPLEKNKLIEAESPRSDYPCVIFDLRNLINHLYQQEKGKNALADEKLLDALKFDESQMSSSAIGVLNNMLLSYLAGLINQKSQMAYGKDYIEIQPQGSFGSLRPSITDTGYSFRLSPGLVPDSFKRVLADAYEDFLDELNKKETQKALLDLLKQETMKDKHNSKGTKIISENAARIKIADLAENNESLESICKRFVDAPEMTLESFNQVAVNSNSEAQREITTITFKQNPQAPETLLALYHNLVDA